MKINTLTAAALALLLATPSIALAERPEGPPPGPGLEMLKKLDLSKEEKARLRQLREEAMEDPELAELREKAMKANKELFDAMRDRLRASDPQLEQKISGAVDQMREKWGHLRKGHDHMGLANLTEEERQKLNAARQTAKSSPAVEAAAAKRKSAATPEEKRAAAKEYAEAMKSAILTADPSLGPVLDKVAPRGKKQD